MKQFDGIHPAEATENFSGELRAYQATGLGWFNFLRQFGMGGVLADDMGLGKTIQVLAMLAGRKAELKKEMELPENAARRRAAPRRALRQAEPHRRPAVGHLQLDRRGREVHPRPEGPRLLRPRPPEEPQEARPLQPGRHQLRPHAAQRRGPAGRRLQLRRARRGPGDQEPQQPVREGGSHPQRRAPPRAHRHARREPPRRPVVHLRVPEPRHARQQRQVRRARPRRRRLRRHRTVGDAPRLHHEGADRRPAAAADNAAEEGTLDDDDSTTTLQEKKPGDKPRSSSSPAPCVPSSCVAPRSRSSPTCRPRPSRPSSARWTRPSGRSTTTCGTTTAAR